MKTRWLKIFQGSSLLCIVDINDITCITGGETTLSYILFKNGVRLNLPLSVQTIDVMYEQFKDAFEVHQ